MIYEPDALVLAPLSGFTDAPYRRSARRCGCRYAFTEMVDAASLTFAFDRSKDLLLRYEDEEFLGVQLLGGNADHIKEAVLKLNEFNFDVLDFNLGCPVPKVAKNVPGQNWDSITMRRSAVLTQWQSTASFPLQPNCGSLIWMIRSPL